eukprot:4806249-Pyramimonas_sp.AAC.1
MSHEPRSRSRGPVAVDGGPAALLAVLGPARSSQNDDWPKMGGGRRRMRMGMRMRMMMMMMTRVSRWRGLRDWAGRSARIRE